MRLKHQRNSRDPVIDQGIFNVNGGHDLWESIRQLYTFYVSYKSNAMEAKPRRTSIRGGCIVGPTRSVSLSKLPLEDLADASKTILTLVVEHFAHSVHRKVEDLVGWLTWGTVFACCSSKYSFITAANS